VGGRVTPLAPVLVGEPPLNLDVRRRTISMRHLTVFALLILLSGCQCFAPVSASGSIHSGVVIEVEGRSSPITKHARLQRLGVYVQDGAGVKPVWRIRGDARTNSVTYGKVPRGMTEEAPAAPLESGRKYYVSLDGDTAGGLISIPCRGRAAFTINSAGELVACSEEGTACG
jgi:hypothetical protein